MIGTVMVFIAPDGRPIAHAADFYQQAPGGFTIEEAQRSRCGDALSAAVVNAFASPALADVMDRYSRSRIIIELEKAGYRTHTMIVEVPKC